MKDVESCFLDERCLVVAVALPALHRPCTVCAGGLCMWVPAGNCGRKVGGENNRHLSCTPVLHGRSDG